MEKTAATKRSQKVSGEPAWYCLRSQPKHEHIAAAHLRMLEGVTVFCPRIRFKRKTRQGLVWVTEAMFPGYLFGRFALAEMHRCVGYAHGVSGFVQFGDRYPTIEDRVIVQLQQHTGAAEIKELSYELLEGDQVIIVEGVFIGLEAVVTQVLPTRQRVKVLMDFLGRKMEAEVVHSSILLRVAHPLAA